MKRIAVCLFTIFGFVTVSGFAGSQSAIPAKFSPPAEIFALVENNTARFDFINRLGEGPATLILNAFRAAGIPRDSNTDAEEYTYGSLHIRIAMDEPIHKVVFSVTKELAQTSSPETVSVQVKKLITGVPESRDLMLSHSASAKQLMELLQKAGFKVETAFSRGTIRVPGLTCEDLTA